MPVSCYFVVARIPLPVRSSFNANTAVIAASPYGEPPSGTQEEGGGEHEHERLTLEGWGRGGEINGKLQGTHRYMAFHKPCIAVCFFFHMIHIAIRSVGSRETAAPKMMCGLKRFFNACLWCVLLYFWKGVAAIVGSPADRISFAELKIPDAKKSIPMAKVTVAVEGWEPIKGVPLDLLGCSTHVFKMSRMEVRRRHGVGGTGGD